MSPDQERRLEEIFGTARNLPPQERAAFLAHACGANVDVEQSRQADSLLAAHEQSGHSRRVTPG